MWREDRSAWRCAKGAKNLALLRNAALAILPFEQHSSINAAFDHYRDYRGASLKLIKRALRSRNDPVSQSPCISVSRLTVPGSRYTIL